MRVPVGIKTKPPRPTLTPRRVLKERPSVWKPLTVLIGAKPLLPAICVRLRMRDADENRRDESTRPTALVPARRTTLPATTTSFASWAEKVFPTGSLDETVWFVCTSNVVPAGIVTAKDHDGTSQALRRSRRICVLIAFRHMPLFRLSLEAKKKNKT
jgi:hypothetical protein